MIIYNIPANSTDVSVVIRIIDSTDGTPETGVEHNTSGIDLEYRREGAASVDITEASLAALTTAHTDGGIEHIGNGYYRLDLPDAAVASGASGVLVHGTITGMIVIGCYIHLTPYPVDVRQFGGTNGTFASGRPEVNTTHAAGTAWNSGAIGANTLAADTITAAKIANAAIDAATFAADVDAEILSYLVDDATRIDASALNTLSSHDPGEAIMGATDLGTGSGLTSLASAANLSTLASAVGTVDTVVDAIKVTTDKLDDTLEDQGGGTYGFTEASLAEAPTGGGSDVFVLRANTAQAGTTGSITLDSGAPATNDLYKSNVVFITSGTGAGQSRYISGYTGSTKVATVEPDFVVAPDNTSEFVIAPFGTDPATIESLVAAFWAAQRSEHQVAGSFGERVLADVTHVSGDSAAADNLEALVDGTGLTLTNVVLPWNPDWDAEVQSEAADALAAYDPPTNAEMEARTLIAANYATAAALTTVDGVVDAIKVTTDALTFTVAGHVDVNVRYVRNDPVGGAPGTKWTRGS